DSMMRIEPVVLQPYHHVPSHARDLAQGNEPDRFRFLMDSDPAVDHERGRGWVPPEESNAGEKNNDYQRRVTEDDEHDRCPEEPRGDSKGADGITQPGTHPRRCWN